MPTYEYRCPACGHAFEKFEKMNSRARAKCPKCGKRAERVISGGVGLVFKGSGFYITDYKRAAEPKGESSDKPAPQKNASKKDDASKTSPPPKASEGE